MRSRLGELAAELLTLANTNARRLRKTMTDAEQALWRHLRERQLDGHRFRRQVPIGPYIVDFACMEARLIVEVDVGQHSVNAERDQERDQWLGAVGYRVVRFWNNDVLSNREGVLTVIADALAELQSVTECHPHPIPPPSRGRGPTE